MKNQIKIEELIKAAKAGDKIAEAKFFSKLSVRFSSLTKRELQKYTILRNNLDISETSQEICRDAISEVKGIYPLNRAQWSLKKAMIIFQNVLENFILKHLTGLAKGGDHQAENTLFSILRKKLLERINYKR